MQKIYGIIYKGINNYNSKVYIGQTINSLEIRTNQHKKLNHIIDKWEIIDKAYSREELDNKEKYWIDFYDSMNPAKGYNRQYGKGNWSKEAIIQRKIKHNSNKEWFKYLPIYSSKYFYSIDIDEINEFIKESYNDEGICLSRAQLCILKLFSCIICKNNKKYKIGNKTILISFLEILKELPYLKNYPHIENQYDNLISNFELFDFIKEKSIQGMHKKENDWLKDKLALSFSPGVIKKYRKVHEVYCELDKDDFDDGYNMGIINE